MSCSARKVLTRPLLIWLMLFTTILWAGGSGLGCNYGGRGGGPSGGQRVSPGAHEAVARLADPVERGGVLFVANGCVLCHGEQGQGKVKNANSETGGEINGLTLVKEGYSKDELIETIRAGVSSVGKDQADGPTPPLRMPEFGQWLSQDDLADLSEYLFSLYPADRASQWDDWDAE